MCDNFIFSLSNNLKKASALNSIQQKLISEFAIKLKVGVEIEFYLTPNTIADNLQHPLQKYNFKMERGKHQYEIELGPEQNLLYIHNSCQNVISNIKSMAILHGGRAEFNAKPYLLDYGNALQFHIELLDLNDNNLFADQEDFFSFVASSICHFMRETFLVFACSEVEFLRFDKNFMAPTHIAFGGNNRTTALRTPSNFPRRIEHRLASPITCSYLALYTILNSIYLGMRAPENIQRYVKIYGNAYDEQYNLTPLPTNLAIAKQYFNGNFFSIT